MFVRYLYITFSGIVPGCHLFVNGRLSTEASCSIRATFPSKRWLFMYPSSFVTVTTVQVIFFFISKGTLYLLVACLHHFPFS